MKVLSDNTFVVGRDGSAVALLAGATVPDWAADQIGGHLLVGPVAAAASVARPPLKGPGSSLAAWQAYADALGVDSSGTRDEIAARIPEE